MGSCGEILPGGGKSAGERSSASAPGGGGGAGGAVVADVRRCLGMDGKPVQPLSRFQADRGSGWRVQRQVHVQPDGVARRILRDAAVAYSSDLSQLLSAPCALAIYGHTVSQWQLASTFSSWRMTQLRWKYARVSVRHPSGYPRNCFTTRSAPTSSSRSPSCRSTTSRAPSGLSLRPMLARFCSTPGRH